MLRKPGRIERELILGTDAVELVVEDAVAAADDRAVAQLVDGADARREVVLVGLDQRAILERPSAGEHQAAGAAVAAGSKFAIWLSASYGGVM